jgi:hypothetical protein
MKMAGRIAQATTFSLFMALSAHAQEPPVRRPAQPPDKPQSPAKATEAPIPSPTPLAFTLRVTPERVVTIAAKEAKAADIGQALAKELRVPVKMSAIVAKQSLTFRLDRVPVEDLLLKLAPQVYIDYEVRWDRPQEDWVAVELTGFNEREPATPVEQKAFLVFAGNTEDEAATEETIAAERNKADEEKLAKDPPKEGPVLDVSVSNGLVSVRARKQMVTAVLLEVASKGGLGFETRGQLDEAFVDLDIRATPVDQLPGVIARPNFGVLMRRNLAAGVNRAVAVLLGTDATRRPPALPAAPARRE